MPQQLPAIISKILAARNITGEEAIQRFLFPRLDQLPHPSGMKGMDDAVSIIIEAMEEGTDLLIWGDYDVDGTTGTSLLVNFFRELGVEPRWFIPDRLKEGYGLHSEKFLELHEANGKCPFVLITVDCGISNTREVASILELGGKVIVTDHHQLPTGELPGCVILNPNQEGCDFREEKLAGVGVAFYLAAALRSELERKGFFHDGSRPNLKEYLGFVALGTISDLVEITDTNRVLVRAGMEALSGSSIPGLKSLLEGAGLYGGTLTTEDISFSLGPRINAAGRLGSADSAVELMTCDNIVAGVKLSKTLELCNDKRKALCSENLETALSKIESEGVEGRSAIIVQGEFHAGVIGIVASKIVEIYRRPTIVFARETKSDDEVSLKGSGRSMEGIDLLECLHQCAPHIDKYGGHAMAAGLTVSANNFRNFSMMFAESVQLAKLNELHAINKKPNVFECDIDELMTQESLDYLLKIEPFGPRNEKPEFLAKNAQVVNCKAIGGNGQHLQLVIRGKFANYRGVGFGLGERYDDVRKNPQRDIRFTPMLNRFRGSLEWQLRVIDI